MDKISLLASRECLRIQWKLIQHKTTIKKLDLFFKEICYFLFLLPCAPLYSFRNEIIFSLIRTLGHLKYISIVYVSKVMGTFFLHDYRTRIYFSPSCNLSERNDFKSLYNWSKFHKRYLLAIGPNIRRPETAAQKKNSIQNNFDRIAVFPWYVSQEWFSSLAGVRHPKRLESEILSLSCRGQQHIALVFPVELLIFSGFLRHLLRSGELLNFSAGMIGLSIDTKDIYPLRDRSYEIGLTNSYTRNLNQCATQTRSFSIGVVVPNMNGGKYLEESINSILVNKGRDDELILVDGGSTDNSIEIINRYRKYFDACIVEKDNGQSHALNKGLRILSTDYITWLCSDDYYEKGCFDLVRDAAKKFDTEIVVGGCLVYDQLHGLMSSHYSALPFLELTRLKLPHLLQFSTFWQKGYFFYQPEVFFRKSLFERVGASLDEGLYYAMDYDLFLRMSAVGSSVVQIPAMLATSRRHSEQKTQLDKLDYLPSVEEIINKFR